MGKKKKKKVHSFCIIHISLSTLQIYWVGLVNQFWILIQVTDIVRMSMSIGFNHLQQTQLVYKDLI